MSGQSINQTLQIGSYSATYLDNVPRQNVAGVAFILRSSVLQQLSNYSSQYFIFSLPFLNFSLREKILNVLKAKSFIDSLQDTTTYLVNMDQNCLKDIQLRVMALMERALFFRFRVRTSLRYLFSVTYYYDHDRYRCHRYHHCHYHYYNYY